LTKRWPSEKTTYQRIVVPPFRNNLSFQIGEAFIAPCLGDIQTLYVIDQYGTEVLPGMADRPTLSQVEIPSASHAIDKRAQTHQKAQQIEQPCKCTDA
jgi:hypothetical protein